MTPVGSRRWWPALIGVLGALLVTALLAGAACTSEDEAKEPPPSEAPPAAETASRAGGRLVYGLLRESEGWNPATSIWSPSGEEVARALFDTLAAFDDEGEPRPDLAESITPDPTWTTWTIRLRPDVRLQDGRAVDAAVVAQGLEVYRTAPQTGAVLEPVAGVAPDGDRAVVVTMRRPWVTFPYVLAGRAGIVADPDWLRSGAPDGPVGTGPFRLTSWEPGNRLIASRNPDYWRVDPQGTRLPYLDEVEFRPIPDPGVREAALRGGTIDLMQTRSSGQIESLTALADDGDVQFFTAADDEPAETVIALDTAVPPFDDPEARRAVSLATDADAYADAVEGGTFEPATGPYPEGSTWYAPAGPLEPDRDAAAELAARVAARNGGTFRFVVLAPVDAHALAGLRYLVDRWAEAGIVATVEPVPPVELDRRVATGTFQAALVEDFDGTHPVEEAARWHPRSVAPVGSVALNPTRWADPALGAALDAAEQTADVDEQRSRYADAQRRLAEGLPYVWLHHGDVGIAAVEGVEDVVTWSLPDGTPGQPLTGGTHPLWQVWRVPAP